MFNLRDVEIPCYGEKQAANQHCRSRVRRRAAQKAWATRIARYGPTGRRSEPVTRTTVSTQKKPRNRNGRARRSESSPTPQARVSDTFHDSTTGPEGDLDSPVIDPSFATESTAESDPPPRRGRDEVGARTRDGSDGAEMPDRTERAPSPPPRPLQVAEQSQHHDMIRLLDERRARVLGPQNISAPSTSWTRHLEDRFSPEDEIEPTPFAIFVDPRVEDENGNDEDKENERPSGRSRDALRTR
ncbi:uncharacterized protein PV09_04078 [Verruconis gallopava]|uniref:Uncharacterized protein n=1 Tax=Verruconis gallopava TaxID=253628 RepID=A0A0D1YW42_9PEZI|nr:uncharacterized protein PV09_04078 [Verruconis gallopava]KIW04907.1 hypothetical protein PV09_04078 [Verruconis gallopava]